MNTPRLSALLLALSLPLGAFAQNVLLAGDGGSMDPVVAVDRLDPIVLRDGKRVKIHATAFSLAKAESYFPAMVKFDKIHVLLSGRDTADGTSVNNIFHLDCTLESAYSLEDVFLVLVLEGRHKGARSIFVEEVAKVKANECAYVDVTTPMEIEVDSGRYRAHLFSKGREVFTSKMRPAEIEAAIAEMVRKKIENVDNAPARPFFGPGPVFPKSLRKSVRQGKAVLKLAIDPAGAVSEPSVVEASAPEFGTAALEAVRQWRFLPKVANGQPVPSVIKMPFDFNADKK